MKQKDMGEGKDVEFLAEGLEEVALKEKVRELFEERDGRVRWVLPRAPREHRKAVNPGRWPWKSKGEDEEDEDPEICQGDANEAREPKSNLINFTEEN